MSYLDKLKLKWGITSNFQLIIILVVFSITGSASLYVARPVLEMVGITNDLSPWVRVPLRILAILPVYQVMLLVVGAVFGQFRFFLNLQKKWMGRFVSKNRNK
jgi:ferrochelatase